MKIDYGLFRVLGLKYDIKSPFDFEISICLLLPFIVPRYQWAVLARVGEVLNLHLLQKVTKINNTKPDKEEKKL